MKPGHVFTIEPMICEGECDRLRMNNVNNSRDNYRDIIYELITYIIYIIALIKHTEKLWQFCKSNGSQETVKQEWRVKYYIRLKHCCSVKISPQCFIFY